MAVEVRMPKLGMTMDTGVVTQWLKAEGESVVKGEPVAEITTEKIATEIESPGDGVLGRIIVPAGQEVPVGALLGLIGALGEDVSSPGAQPESTPSPATPPTANVGEAMPPVPSAEEDGGVKASPVARRLAREHDIDLALVKPSSGGRISRDDVLAYLAARQGQPEGQGSSELARNETQDRPPAGTTAAAPSTSANGAEAVGGIAGKPSVASSEFHSGAARTIPLVGMRKTIADHLVESLRSGAQLTVSIEVDVTELVKAREVILPGFQMATGVRPTYTDMLVLLVARSLQQNPILNSTLVGNEILIHEDVHMGVAVAIENGLIVPVIRKAQDKRLGDITRARTELTTKAVEGRLSRDEITGGTFTITNPGVPGADISTPILNSPQNAILGVGRFVKKPVVRNDEICVRQMCWLSVTFDHRAMDGMPVVRFLDTLGGMLQEPMKFLSDV